MGMYKLSYENIKSPDGTEYNDLPRNWRQVSEEEFAKAGLVSHSWDKVEFRQMYRKTFDGKRDIRGGMIEARLFWFSDDTGLAISTDHWKGKVNFYKFGCHHSLDHKKFLIDEKNICKNCKEDISEPWMLLVKNDSGWSMNEHTSRPGRGIRDYNRKIEFIRSLSDTEIESVRSFLAKVDCPGWTGVTSRWTGYDVIDFSTTYDSSD